MREGVNKSNRGREIKCERKSTEGQRMEESQRQSNDSGREK